MQCVYRLGGYLMKFVECRERKRLTADSLGIQYVDVLTEE